MSQTLPSTRFEPATPNPISATPLSTVVYRSRAVHPLSAPELHQLALNAQARNRRESLTGLVVYDRETFFQWLEGPTDSLGRVLDSIMHDPRHTDIQILDNQPADTRRFANWHLKVAARLDHSSFFTQEVIEPPRRMIDELHRHPDEAPTVLAELGSATAPAARKGDKRRRQPDATEVLRGLIQSTVIPELSANLRDAGLNASSHARPADPRAPELARLLIAPDPREAAALIETLRAREPSVLPLFGSLFEPAARSLGDLWNDDLCSEVDVTIGLGRLQANVRLLSAADLPPVASAVPCHTVLVAPEPGELHLLGAAMDSEVLWHAGWAAHCEYPATDSALQDLVSTTWFDALDLSLSTAFRREHWLPKITETIARARSASRNPALVVVVGGRVFNEQADAGQRVGADAASSTTLDIAQVILRGLERHVTAS